MFFYFEYLYIQINKYEKIKKDFGQIYVIWKINFLSNFFKIFKIYGKGPLFFNKYRGCGNKKSRQELENMKNKILYFYLFD